MHREDDMEMLSKLHQGMVIKRLFSCCLKEEQIQIYREVHIVMLSKLHQGLAMRRLFNYCLKEEQM